MDVAALLNFPNPEEDNDIPDQTQKSVLRGYPESNLPIPSIELALGRSENYQFAQGSVVKDQGEGDGGRTLSREGQQSTSPVASARNSDHVTRMTSSAKRRESVSYRRRASSSGMLPLTELRQLQLSPKSSFVERRRPPQTPSEVTRHKLSDSQSSLSSLASSAAHTHSRTSSITTVEDEHTTLINSPDSYANDMRLTTVQEEPSSRLVESKAMPKNHYGGIRVKNEITDVQLDIVEQPLRRRLRSDTNSSGCDWGAIRPYVSPIPRHFTLPTHKRTLSAPGFKLESASEKPGRQPLRLNHRRRVSTMSNIGTGPLRVPARSMSQQDLYTQESNESLAKSDLTPEHECEAPQVASIPELGVSKVDCSKAFSSRTSPSSPLDGDVPFTPITPIVEAGVDLKCMFTENCDTGAQLRKAISHFFGRNKSCTLKIPPYVWVHYCRKHYQRIRYRNSKDYGLIQIDLVRKQVEMLQNWSQNNQHNGKGRYIQEWTLALRKREQQRLDELGASSALDGNSSCPQWVYDSLRGGYTSEQVVGMVDRLKSELLDKTIEDIPEIEFLPDIVGEHIGGEGKTPRPRKTTKRTASRANLQQQDLRLGSTHASPQDEDDSVGPGTVISPTKRSRLEYHGQSIGHVSNGSEFLGTFDHNLSAYPGVASSPRYLSAPPFHELETTNRTACYSGQVAETPRSKVDPSLIISRESSSSWPFPGYASQNPYFSAQDSGRLEDESDNRLDRMGDRLPPLSGYKHGIRPHSNQTLPPIPVGKHLPGTTTWPSYSASTAPRERPRASTYSMPLEQQSSVINRPSSARSSGSHHEQWPATGQFSSRGHSGSCTPTSSGYPQTSLTPYYGAISPSTQFQFPRNSYNGPSYASLQAESFARGAQAGSDLFPPLPSQGSATHPSYGQPPRTGHHSSPAPLRQYDPHLLRQSTEESYGQPRISAQRGSVSNAPATSNNSPRSRYSYGQTRQSSLSRVMPGPPTSAGSLMESHEPTRSYTATEVSQARSSSNESQSSTPRAESRHLTS